MSEKKEILADFKAILQKAQIEPNSKYLSAKKVEAVFGINHKTVLKLNRSNLPKTHRRYIPSVRLKGGRKKYFERKVIERLLVSRRADQ